MPVFELVEEELEEGATTTSWGPASLLAEAPKGTIANSEEEATAGLFVAGASTNILFKTLSMAAFSSGVAFFISLWYSYGLVLTCLYWAITILIL